ncbi:hypothetical protein D3C86_1675730 [compost metagenome]
MNDAVAAPHEIMDRLLVLKRATNELFVRCWRTEINDVRKTNDFGDMAKPPAQHAAQLAAGTGDEQSLQHDGAP